MLVSVVMITYGHEKYIIEAIDGVLKQKCEFDLELIIANDCSPDGTDYVVKNYIKKLDSSVKIKYFRHNKNIGMISNFIFALQQAKGEYIALCDGDDYWTDSNKLQKQFTILENNKECILCFTNNSKLFNNGVLKNADPKKIKTKSSFKDIVEDNYIATLTVLFKKPNNFILPEWYNKLKIGDWPLYLILLSKGQLAYFLDDDTAVYRYGVGVSNILNKKNSLILEEKQNILKSLYLEKLESKYISYINSSLKNNNRALLTSYIRESNFKKSFLLFTKLIFKDNCIKIFRLTSYAILKKINK